MPPDNFITIFDGVAVVVMFAWGFAVKYFPPLAKVPNWLIAWTNVIGYVATKLVQGQGGAAQPVGVLELAVPLQAGFLGSLNITHLVGGFANSVWARQLYEGFGRHLIEQKLGIKKAEPK